MERLLMFGLLLMILIQPCLGFDYVFGNTNFGTAREDYEPSTGQPAQWETYVDPNTNMLVRRISDISDIPGSIGIFHNYGHRSMASIDGRYLLVYVNDAPGNNPVWIYDLVDQTAKEAPHRYTDSHGVYYENCPGAEGGKVDMQPEYVWSRETPEHIYYRYGAEFYRGDVTYPEGQAHSAEYNVLVRDFKGDFPSLCTIGFREKGDLDKTGRYAAFIGLNMSHCVEVIFTYDIQEDEIIATLTSEDGLPCDPWFSNWIGMTPDAQVMYAGRFRSEVDEPFNGVRVFSKELDSSVLLASESRHNGICKVGDNLHLFQINNAACDKGDDLCFSDINDGTYFSHYNQGDFGWDGHHLYWHYGLSPNDVWCGAEWYADELDSWNDNQIIFVEARETDARIWRVAHFQIESNDALQAQGTQGMESSINFDDTRIYFTSNWWGDDNPEVYEVILPDDWWNEIDNVTIVCMDITELVSIVDDWKLGLVTMDDLMGAIVAWKG